MIVRSDESVSMRETLRRHVRGIELVNIEDIDVGTCQRGGCWERLCYVLERSRNQYVVQVDSDTLALGDDVADVTDCIQRNRAFTMAGSEHWGLQTMLEAATEARTRFPATTSASPPSDASWNTMDVRACATRADPQGSPASRAAAFRLLGSRHSTKTWNV